MTRRRRHTPDQIIRKLAEGNKFLSAGTELNEVCCATGASSAARAGGNTGTKPMLSSLASVLNLSTSQIQQDRSNGQSLSQIASTQGVSQSKLLSTIESSLQNGPVGPSITSDQLTDMATTIAHNPGTFPPPPPSSQNTQPRRPEAISSRPLSNLPRASPTHIPTRSVPAGRQPNRDRKHELLSVSGQSDHRVTSGVGAGDDTGRCDGPSIGRRVQNTTRRPRISKPRAARSRRNRTRPSL
jgi:hypothetical protein